MKRIGVYLQSGPTCGGTYQYNQLIVDALAEIPQYQICAVYAEDHWMSYLNNRGVEGHFVPRSRWWEIGLGLWRRLKLPVALWRKTFGQLHPLTRKLKKQNSDLWIFPSQDPFYWYPVPAVGVVHDLMHRYERQFEEVGEHQEYARREFHYQHSCQFAKAILVDSDLGKQHLESSYIQASQKGQVLPYIAARDIQIRQSTSNFDSKYALPAKYLFYPAQFWRHKNHVRLLQALDRVRQDCPDVQLVLVGSQKNGYQSVLDTIRQLKLQDHVHLFGYVEAENLPQFYRKARALVMPTFFGPTNIPPLEAFALDCPVIISGIYGMKAQLGDAALFVDPNSVEALADAMKRIWVDDTLCVTLIAKGRQHHQNWHFDAFKDRFAKILHAIET